MMKRYFLAALLLAGLFAIALQSGFVSEVFAKEAPIVGSTAPGFSLADVNGKTVTLSKVIKNNNVTLVNFWATWCPPCRAEIPEFIAFYKKYAGKKVEIIAVNLQEGPAELKKFTGENGMKFPIVMDATGKVGDLYQVSAIPTTFIIDRSGKIRHRMEGSTDLKTLEAKIRPLLKK